MKLGIVELYCGKSGKKGYYNSQELGLAKAMARLGVECVVFYPDMQAEEICTENISQGVTMVLVPAKGMGVHSRFDWSILIRYQIDVVQINSDNQMFAPALSKFCEKHGIRQYHYIGTTGSDNASGMKASIMQCLYKRNLAMLRKQKCFAKTETVANELMELGIRDVEIAPVGLDLSVIPQITENKMRLRARLKLPEDKIILLFVGRIDEYKNPLEAVELMARLPMHYYMVMIGTGELDQKLNQKISTLQCANRILRILRVPNEEIHSFYAASDWLVNFNRDEIFGMSILEALYQNCKVLAYHAPGPDYILREVGTVVDSMDDMKAHIMSNNFAREDTSHYVKEHFDWIHTAKIINEWIEE